MSLELLQTAAQGLQSAVLVLLGAGFGCLCLCPTETYEEAPGQPAWWVPAVLDFAQRSLLLVPFFGGFRWLTALLVAGVP